MKLFHVYCIGARLLHLVKHHPPVEGSLLDYLGFSLKFGNTYNIKRRGLIGFIEGSCGWYCGSIYSGSSLWCYLW